MTWHLFNRNSRQRGHCERTKENHNPEFSAITLGHNIRVLRENLNETQEQLGRALKVSRSAVAKWESGVNTPSIQDAIAITEHFHISFEKLLFSEIRTHKKVQSLQE